MWLAKGTDNQTVGGNILGNRKTIALLTAFIFTGCAEIPATRTESGKDALRSGKELSTKAVHLRDVAVVNGVSIPNSRVDALLRRWKGQGYLEVPTLRDHAKEMLIDCQLLVQEAQRRGLDHSVALADQDQELERQMRIAGTLAKEILHKRPISDNALEAEYRRLYLLAGNKEYRVRHVVVATEGEASDIIEQVKKGAKLERFVDRSLDFASASSGGLLNWSLPTSFEASFRNTVTYLEKGQSNDFPIQTSAGFHAVTLEDTRTVDKLPAFTDVKSSLREKLARHELNSFIYFLRLAAKIN